MKNKNYVINYNDKKLNLQIITMNNSYYIYIGDNKVLFENLLLSIPNKIDEKKDINNEKEKGLLPENISCSKLIDDDSNDMVEILNNFLVSKLKVPIFLSMNIYEPILLKDPLFLSFLQENILKLLIQK